MLEKYSCLSSEDIRSYGSKILVESAKCQYLKDRALYDEKIESIFKNTRISFPGIYSSVYDLKDHPGGEERFLHYAFKSGLWDGLIDSGSGTFRKKERTREFLDQYDNPNYGDCYEYGYQASLNLFQVCRSTPLRPSESSYDYHSPVDSKFNERHLKNIAEVLKGTITDQELVNEIQLLKEHELNGQMSELRVPNATSIANRLSLEQINWLASGISEFATWLDGDFSNLDGKINRVGERGKYNSYYEIRNQLISLRLYDSGYAEVRDSKYVVKDLTGVSLVYSQSFYYGDEHGADSGRRLISYEATPEDPVKITFGEGWWTGNSGKAREYQVKFEREKIQKIRNSSQRIRNESRAAMLGTLNNYNLPAYKSVIDKGFEKGMYDVDRGILSVPHAAGSRPQIGELIYKEKTNRIIGSKSMSTTTKATSEGPVYGGYKEFNVYEYIDHVANASHINAYDQGYLIGVKVAEENPMPQLPPGENWI